MIFDDIVDNSFDRFNFNFVRVYLDRIDDINEKIILLNRLIQFLWWNKVLWYIVLWDWNKKLSSKVVNIFRELKLDKIFSGCYILKETSYDEESIWYLHSYILCLDNDLVSSLLKVIFENELWIRDYLNIDIYYYIISKWILINPYDDRWVDFIFVKDNYYIDKLVDKLKLSWYIYKIYKPS